VSSAAPTRGEALAADLEKITIGTSPLGKRPERGELLADAMLASSFRQLDTANNYAAGESERLLGGAIARLGGLPADKVVFSKVDADPVTGVFDADRVRRSFDESRERLGLDVLPLLHFHDPYMLELSDAMAPGGPVEALIALRDEGAVGAIGIAAGRRALMEDYVRTDVFDAVLNHNRWTLVDRSADTLWNLATERRMAVFNAAPFGGGILAGSTTRGPKYAYTEASGELLGFIDRMQGLAAEWGIELAAAAVQFSMGDPRIHSTVVGMSSIARLESLPGLMTAEIPAGFWEAFRALGTPPPSPAA
jgi:D-threo-aldose 1-dehydrogenase